MSTSHYACRFCIAIEGLKSSQVRDLPTSAADVAEHAREAHSYPPEEALAVLLKAGRDPMQANIAAELIERMGVAIAVEAPASGDGQGNG